MKKFFVGLLSVFMICGGIILASCGESKVSLSLDQTYKEIVVLDEELTESAFVTCVVNGVDNGKVSVSSSQTSIVSASVEYNSSSNQNIITLTAGDMEGTATVTVTTLDQTVSEKITVFVHGEVTGMSEKVYTNGQSQLYAIRGGERILDANELIEFETTLNTSRKEVSWALKDNAENDYITLEGNKLSINENFNAGVSEPKVTLTATSIFNPDISEDITLTVLDKIDTSSVNLAFAFNMTDSFESIFDEEGKPDEELIKLTSNREADPGTKTGYIRMTFSDHDKYLIEPVLTYENSNVDVGQISILSDSSANQAGQRYFTIEGKDNANVTAKASFKISHSNFAYSVLTSSFSVKSYEKIDNIKLYDENGIEITGTQNIYNSYSDDQTFGKGFEVALLPTTVIGYTGSYSLQLAVDANYSGANAPIELRYIDEYSMPQTLAFDNGTFDPIAQKIIFKSVGTITAKQIYIRATNVQAKIDATLSFHSVDNANVSTDLSLSIQQAPTSLDFENENEKDIYFSSAYDAVKTLTREFKVFGQTSISGLSVVQNNAFVDKAVIYQIGSSLDEGPAYNGEPYVTFRLSFNLFSNSLGQTREGTYKIIHLNGLESHEFALNVLLPLTDAYMRIDNLTSYNAVVGHKNEGMLLDERGASLANKVTSLSFLMLKNGATLPFTLQTNSVSLGSGSVSSVLSSFDFRFVDGEIFDESNIAEKFDLATQTSKIISVNANASTFSSNSVGTTFMLIKFVGKSIGEDGLTDVTYYRVIKIESFVAPATLSPNVSGVEVYAENSVAEDDNSTSATVIVNFAQNGVTYLNPENFIFEYDPSSSDADKNKRFENNGDTITFGNFNIEDIRIFDSYMRFVVRGLSTGGQRTFNKNLSLAYVYNDGTKSAYIALETSIDITIKNADRIERVIWENYNENGIYFDLSDGNNNSQIIVTSTSPTNARNSGLRFIATGENGNVDNSFIKFSQLDSGSDVVTLNAQTGRNGNIYILPKDAINNERIYFYKGSSVDAQGNIVYIEDSIRISEIGTRYDEIVNNGYFFVNNNNEEIKLSEIIVKVPVKIADGESFDTAYRIYNPSQLSSFNPNKYYTFMNNMVIDSTLAQDMKRVNSGTFGGGIEGITSQTTIIFEGSNFIGINNGTIRNITFAGEVNDSFGFVANTNNGTMQNVTVDVVAKAGEYSFSSLTAPVGNNSVGGLVGLNDTNGKIENCAVLGLNISASGLYAGGLVGTNAGTITSSRVEFYNFASGANKITGQQVAGLAHNNSGRIDRSFAYNYSDQEVLSGDAKALVYTTGKGSTLTVSFASVGVKLGSGIALTNGYVKYPKTDGSGYDIVYYNEYGKLFTPTANNDHFILSGEGYFEYVNGSGNAHLKDVYQENAVSSLDNFTAQTKDTNGYYKTLKVTNEKALGFYYNIASVELSDREKRELDDFNRISLSDFLGEDSSNIVATTSDVYVANIIGNEIVFTGIGNATITIFSKQNYKLSKEIELEVIYSLSPLKATYVFVDRGEEIGNGKTHNLQTGAKRSITYSFDKAFVKLGASATTYYLIENNIELKNNAYIMTTPRVLTITENAEYEEGKLVEVNPIVFGLNEDSQQAVNQEFGHMFYLVTYNGALDLRYSMNKVDVTPATKGSLKAILTTSNQEDAIAPEIKLGNVELEITTDNNSGKYIATYRNGNILENRLSISVSETQTKKVGNNYEKEFLIEISVHDSYKWLVSNAENYVVNFYSNGKTVSDSFDLTVSPQGFNYIDVNNYKVESITSGFIDGNTKDIYHVEKAPSSVLAPGNNSILKVNINPKFANYHHLKISYTGEQTLNAVVMRKMVAKTDENTNSDNATEFYENSTISGVENFGNTLIVTPSLEDRQNGNMFFNIWINQSVNVNNTNLTFVIAFCDAQDQVITSVQSFIRVSYLDEPRIVVNGQRDLSFVAKGERAKGKLYFDADQTVSKEPILIEDATGVRLENQREVESDIAGKRLWEFDIVVDVDAKIQGENNVFKLSAKIFGEVQEKTAENLVTVVDLAINTDANSIKLFGEDSDTLHAYVGVGKILKFDYTLMPESYDYDLSSTQVIEAVRELEQQRTLFSAKGFHREREDGDKYYSINYDKDHRNPMPLAQRVDYFNEETGGWTSVLNSASNTFVSSVNGMFTISATADEQGNFTENSLLITGLKETREGTSVRMRMMTYINYAGQTLPIVKEFYVEVGEFSDEDLPIRVTTETEFLAMAEGNEQNYILADDITLKNYTPISTNAIASLDGNGHVINIESFNTEKTNQTQNTLQLALFNNVTANTTLKNVVVNVYSAGRQILADVDDYSSFEIAGFAISNAGIITNCSVVAYNPDRQPGEEISAVGTYGINVTYIKGTGTTAPQYLTQGSTWSSQIAGFAIRNTGSITNSKVGGDNVYLIGNKYTSDLNDGDPRYDLNIETLEYFNLKGQGNMAGFVLENSGYISASSAKNLSMNNQSEDPQYYTTGFVGNNTRSIITSYVEGVKGNDDREAYKYCRMGSMIQSKMGVVSGFIYQTSNSAIVKDCYSNIGIANSTEIEESYLASGFIYINRGNLYNCYSSSQIQNQTYSQMNFSGVDSNGNLLNTEGTYENCYYYNPAYTEAGNSNLPTESSFNTGAGQLRDVSKQSSFYGFAIGGETSTNTIWKMTLNEGIKLVEPDMLSFSHRYYQVLENQDGVSNERQKYALPYAQIMLDGNYTDLSYGSLYNPIIIRTPQEFIDVTGESKSSSINEKVDSRAVKGVYRLVANLDFNELATSDQQIDGIDIPSTRKSLTGIIYGNGFTISNVNLAGNDETFAYGLFGAIESVKNSSGNVELEAMILNLNFTIAKVTNNKASVVGGLVGLVRDASIVNVNMTFNDGASVEGSNFVGGIVGFAFANSTLKNLTVENVRVTASRRVNGNSDEEILDADSLSDLRKSNEFNTIATSLYSTLDRTTIKGLRTKVEKMSYAGGIAGFLDIFEGNGNDAYYSESDFEKSKDFLTYNVASIKAEGTTFIQSAVAGGLVGLSGSNTAIKDAQLIINGTMTNNQTHIVSTKYYAGAIVGQSFGTLSQLVATHTKDIQETIQINMGRYYLNNSFDKSLERGAIDIFDSISGDYDRIAVGGLVGYVGSGSMNLSYSNLNAVDMNAQYAGGLIGEIELTDKVQVYKSSNGSIQGYKSKYIINQAYASGDVRGNVASGGIIGKLNKNSTADENASVALHAVNSVNFFSVYNYMTDDNYADANNYAINVFEQNNIHAFVGEFAKNSDDGTKLPNDTITNSEGQTADNTNIVSDLSPWISFVVEESHEIQQDENGNDKVITTQGPTVSRIYRYFTTQTTQNQQTTNVNVSPLFAPNVRSEKIKGKIGEAEVKYLTMTEEPAKYTDIKTGKSFTQGSFLNNSYWSSDNWIHEDTTLFPTLKYTDAFGYIFYLDAYDESIKATLDAMRLNKNIEVVVRGRVSKDTENQFADVDIRDYLQRNRSVSAIESFAGTIRGGGTTTSNDNPVKVILDKPLFSNIASGFTIRDTVISFENNGSTYDNLFTIGNNVFAGAFVNGAMTEAVISNMTFEFNSPGIKLIGKNVGLIATELQSTNVSGTKIVLNTEKWKGNETFLTVSPAVENVGLFAGQLIQNSAVRQMNFSMNTIEVNGDNLETLIAVNLSTNNNQTQIDTNKSLSLGAMIGYVSQAENTQPFRVDLQSVTTQTLKFDTTNSTYSTIQVGGLIGFVNKNIGLSANSNITSGTNQDFVSSELSAEKEGGDLFYGGLVGKVSDSGGTVSISNIGGGSSQIKTKLNSSNRWGKIYYGGLVGESERQISVQNFKTYNVTNRETSATGMFNLSNDLVYTTNSISADKIYYGGLVGQGTTVNISAQSNANIEFSSASDEHVNIISLNASEVHAGGLVGRANTATLNGNGKVRVTDSFNIKGGTTNSIANIGGFVGDAENITIQTSGVVNGKISRYDGHILLDTSSSINAGGIVGSISFNSENNNQPSNTATLNKLSFGGDIRLSSRALSSGESSTTNLGGTAGYIKASSINLSNNYNYGDVFVAKNKALIEENYFFGGLIGKVDQVDGATGTVTTSSNYSLVTHNSDKTTKDSSGVNIKALFGSGKSSAKENNFYNHGVTLTTDDQGTDMAYMTGYSVGSGRYGYGDYHNEISNNVITTIIKQAVEGNFGAGTKLNPIELTGMESESKNAKISGTTSIKYYYLSSDLEMTWENDSKSYTLSNVAIVGDAFTLSLNSFKGNFINSISNYSYISDLVVNVKDMIVGENNKSGELKVGGLVGELKRGIIFAVGIDGNIEVAGSKAVAVGGLVGNMQGGTISDSYSVADILYRASSTGSTADSVSASGIIGFGSANEGGAYIHGTFSGGSLTSYIDANLHAFAGGSGISISNSYTYTYLDWNDHTSAETSSSEKLDVWGKNTTLKNAVYDRNAINSKTNNTTTYETLRDELSDNWIKDNYDYFNFGYPTRTGFNYLRPSSVYEITNYNEGEETVTDLNAGKELTNKSESATTHKFEYIRLTVKETVELAGTDKEYAYGIPNASIFENISEKNLNSNIKMFTLLNDIDLSNTSIESWNPFTINIDNDNNKITQNFDGNGHTLHNFQNTIFESLKGGKVTNLRITNDADKELSAPLLVGTLNGTTVSNLTLSGRITGTVNNDLGAVANLIKNEGVSKTSTLTAVTNMVNIAVDADKENAQDSTINVGGLVGRVEGNLTVNYSSNYAPIELANGKTAQSLYVGGLVGQVMSGTLNIYNSYNANAIISGYRSSISGNEVGVNADYKAGGLVGYEEAGETNIYNSYNSGIIKAGNKNVGENNKVSYAGGIIGHAESTITVSNCFNEGSIEALGKDPETVTEIQASKGSSVGDGPLSKEYSNMKITVTLLQKEGQKVNVHAYGIGYFGDDGIQEFKCNSSGEVIRNGIHTSSESNALLLSSVEVTDGYGGIKKLYNGVDIENCWSFGYYDSASLANKNALYTYFESYYYRLYQPYEKNISVANGGINGLLTGDVYDIPVKKDADGKIVGHYKQNLSFDDQMVPVSTVYRIPYQNYVQLAVPGAKAYGIDARVRMLYFGMYENYELLQVNFFDGKLRGTGSESSYNGYASVFNGSNISNKNNENSSVEIDNIKSNTIYYTSGNFDGSTTINGSSYTLVGNNSDAVKALTAGNTTLEFNVSLNFSNENIDVGNFNERYLSVSVANIYQGDKLVGDYADSSNISHVSGNTYQIQVTGPFKKGVYKLNATVDYRKDNSYNFSDLAGAVVVDDVEGSDTYGLFGIYMPNFDNGFVDNSLSLKKDDKQFSGVVNIVDDKDNLYYMIYNNNTLYFVPGATLVQKDQLDKPVNRIEGTYDLGTFKSIFNANKTFTAMLQETITNISSGITITQEQVSSGSNISVKQDSITYKGTDEFVNKQIVTNYIASADVTDGKKTVVLTLNNNLLFDGFEHKYVGFYDETSDPLFSYDGDGNFNINTGLKYIAPSDSAYIDFEIVSAQDNEVTIVLDSEANINDFIAIINNNSKIAPIIKLENKHLGSYDRVDSIDDNYELQTSIWSDYSSGIFVNGEEFYEIDESGNIVIKDISGKSYTYGNVTVYDQYQALTFNMGVKVISTITGEDRNGSIIINGEEKQGFEFEKTLNANSSGMLNVDIVGKVEYDKISQFQVVGGQNETVTLTDVNLNFVSKEDKTLSFSSHYDNNFNLDGYSIIKHFDENNIAVYNVALLDGYTQISDSEQTPIARFKDGIYEKYADGTWNQISSSEIEAFELTYTTIDENEQEITRNFTINLAHLPTFAELEISKDYRINSSSKVELLQNDEDNTVGEYLYSKTTTSSKEYNFKDPTCDNVYGTLSDVQEGISINLDNKKATLQNINASKISNSVSFNTVESQEFSVDKTDIFKVTRDPELLNLILTEDIFVNTNAKANNNKTLTQQISISGNGYSIRFYNGDNPLFSSHNSNYFISNCQLLGVVKQQTFLKNYANTKNVSTYGIIINPKTSTQIIHTTNTNESILNSFVSVKATDAYNFGASGNDITLGSAEKIANYGSLFAGNGKYGKSYTSMTTTQNGGGNGGNGGKIIIQDKNNNHGLIVAGYGGNGGSEQVGNGDDIGFTMKHSFGYYTDNNNTKLIEKTAPKKQSMKEINNVYIRNKGLGGSNGYEAKIVVDPSNNKPTTIQTAELIALKTNEEIKASDFVEGAVGSELIWLAGHSKSNKDDNIRLRGRKVSRDWSFGYLWGAGPFSAHLTFVWAYGSGTDLKMNWEGYLSQNNNENFTGWNIFNLYKKSGQGKPDDKLERIFSNVKNGTWNNLTWTIKS